MLLETSIDKKLVIEECNIERRVTLHGVCAIYKVIYIHDFTAPFSFVQSFYSTCSFVDFHVYLASLFTRLKYHSVIVGSSLT